jgi:3-deoxy-D-manno-octulosonate 8-phosphate phosphatase (KDO 8-P phosphatase)
MDLSKIKLIVLDFDGVLTNNKVLLNEHGEEFVSCSRGDGIAFDALRKLQIKTIILSTEKNKVVSSRANKLQIDAIQGVTNKKEMLVELIKEDQLSKNEVVFIGNDINDINAMLLCKFTFCPSDSHKLVKKMAKIVLEAKGGDEIMREVLEGHFKIDLYKLLYTK